MTRDQHHTGGAAVAYFALGISLEILSTWLVLTNVLLSSYGMVAALAGSATVRWDGIFPILVSSGPQTLSTAAGFLLGALVSIVEILVWRKALDWDEMALMARSTIWAIVVYDVTSTVWGLTSGQFYDPANSTASVVRLAMAMALTVFAFSVGAERWAVLGFQLAAQNWRETAYTLHWMPRPKKEQRENDNRQQNVPQHALQDVQQRIREEQSRRDKQRAEQKRQAEQRQQQTQRPF